MTSLEGKVAIVTGATGAIGKAIVSEFARAGACLACVAPEHCSALEDVVAGVCASGGKAIAAPADVTDPAQVAEMVKGVVAHFGEVSILVNNAGSFRALGPIWEVDAETWWGDVGVNLLGPFLCCREVLPMMIRLGSGVIINIAGGGFDRPHPGASAYASSKAGLARLTDTLAEELKRRQSSVRVHALVPGLVRSALTEGIATVPAGREWLFAITDGLAAGKELDAAAIGRSVLALIGASSDSLNGRILHYSDDPQAVAARLEGEAPVDLFQLRYVRS